MKLSSQPGAVELTLIPLAAILLLLSGACDRARLAEVPSVSASLLRSWLERENAEAGNRSPVRAVRTRRPHTNIDELKSSYRNALDGVVQQTRTTAQRLERSLLLGRFDVRSAAVLATAPPQG